MKRILTALTLAAALALNGCGSKTTTSSSSGTTGKVYTIGFSQCNLGEPYRVQMNADIKAAAERHKDKLKVIYKNAENETTTQQNQIKEFVQQGVDMIIVSPLEGVPLTKPIAEAYDKGIPVIVLDRAVLGDKFTCFIGADNKEIGYEAGKHIVKLLKEKGNVIELQGRMTTKPALDRHEGFIKAIKDYNIVILADPDCLWLEPNAQREMKSALRRFDNIDLVYGHNDPSAHGAYIAAKQEGKGREKTIKFIGIDGLPHEGQKYVEQGILDATFVYPTCGPEAIDTAVKILDGQKAPKNINLPTKLITRETLSDK